VVIYILSLVNDQNHASSDVTISVNMVSDK